MSLLHTLLALALVYGQLSLLAFGGANAVIPEMQRQVVDVHHWMTARDFGAMFALAQAAPGPNMMVVKPAVGWRVAGLRRRPGHHDGYRAAIPSVLTFAVAGLWFRFRDRPWRKARRPGRAATRRSPWR